MWSSANHIHLNTVHAGIVEKASIIFIIPVVIMFRFRFFRKGRYYPTYRDCQVRTISVWKHTRESVKK
jgi:hypothetical protein